MAQCLITYDLPHGVENQGEFFFLLIETNGTKPKSVEIEREITAVNSIEGDSFLNFVLKITNLCSCQR